ncbi:tetratricopeptide repeat protein [Thalassotalea atypica]|uniref:tetratricopeptide repeat protein n=1 Tax=Thalassotalea atypica TaxID=2054316 RepID=UPI0025746ADE|nr:tetratricopeptide repeat protein [Thalassotalea atypica]
MKFASHKAHSVLVSLAMSCSLAIVSSSAKASDSRIHETCETNPQQCLIDIQLKLDTETYQSRVWFQYKLYQLDALFELLELDELYNEVTPWLNADDIPLKFKLAVEIYYAKLLRGKNEKEKAVFHLERAIHTLQDINEVAPDPMLEVQIANALNSLERYQQGYDLLKPLEDKYRNRHMPEFKHELYENLGHFAYRLGDFEQHLQYRLKAQRWAKEHSNKVQIAISTYNIARAYQMLSKYEEAFVYFAKAEEMQAMGKHDQNMIWFRRAEMALEMSELSKAKEYFAFVDREIPSDYYIEMFDQFEVKLKAKREN